jgi:hypothetical protein
VIGAPAEGDRCGLSAAQGDWKHAGAIRGESIKVRVKMTAGDRVIARGGPTSVRWPTSIPQFTCRLSAAASGMGHHRDRRCSKGIFTSSCAPIDLV